MQAVLFPTPRVTYDTSFENIYMNIRRTRISQDKSIIGTSISSSFFCYYIDHHNNNYNPILVDPFSEEVEMQDA
jgi:hypothetical protein